MDLSYPEMDLIKANRLLELVKENNSARLYYKNDVKLIEAIVVSSYSEKLLAENMFSLWWACGRWAERTILNKEKE